MRSARSIVAFFTRHRLFEHIASLPAVTATAMPCLPAAAASQ